MTEPGTNPDQTEKSRLERLAKSAFLGRIGHEFRTPLNSILGFTQLLQQDSATSLSINQQKKIDNIEKAGWHLLQLVNDLLDLTSIENETVEIHIATLMVDASISSSIELIDPLARQRNITVSTEVDKNDDELYVRADPTRLKQVLLNLLTNAIKYNKDGGQVNVSGELSKPDTVRITVSDTGSGIAENEQAAIFEPFTRGSTSLHPDGTGIGLTLVMELVTLMGGNVGLTSRLGEGSSFWIELPRAKKHEMNNFEETENVAGVDLFLNESIKQDLILYIEDSPLHTQLVNEIISKMKGAKMASASTPQRGLELAQALRPNLILLDLCLPEMDGYAVLKCLLQDRNTMNIPVIALSANAMPEDIEKALRSGFRRFITKPIDVKKFERALVELLIDEGATKRV